MSSINLTGNRILIVEDDIDFRCVLSSSIESWGGVVVLAQNGSEAQTIIKDQEIDLLISDIQMPQMDGIELVKWVRRLYDTSFHKKKPLPIVLVTGFAHLFQTQKANELGVNQFLTKPFKNDELNLAVVHALRIEQPEAPDSQEPTPNAFCKVSIEDFVSKQTLEMDIYVQLRQKKYLKIANSGESSDLARLQRYKEKGLQYLYVRKEDYRKVLDFNIMLSKVLAKEDRVSPEKRQRFLAYTSEVIFESAMINGVDEVFFDDAKGFIQSSMDILTEDKQTLSLLELLSKHADGLYAHSLAVSVYSVMIAKKMGWNSSATLFKLSFGALMHDIGKKEIDPSILEKTRAELTFKERQILETHPIRGRAILESLKSASSEVVAIAYEHHENILGQGFPRQINAKNIHPMAKVVSTADDFCLYALKHKDNPSKFAQKAIVLMDHYKKDKLDPDCYEALKKVVKTTS